MTNFVLLYSGGGMPEDEAEQEKIMQAWMAWYGNLGSAVVDAGNPFTPMAKNIASDGTVSDSQGGSNATGYSILAADSLDEAAVMAKGCPILNDGGQIRVLETFPAM